jgi:hypothetical protein
LKKVAECRFLQSFPTKKGKYMTISSLYHTQGIRGYKYQKTTRTADTEVYHLHSMAKQLPCPGCRSWETSIVETGNVRDIRGLRIGFKKR